ncbi:unnamed protein product [Somion occarium]|uniref:Uncharacterized protein n=1 Tax=Somion occarium TaxID=3059160 RepID=A0ABP1CV99_9APHY
MHARFPFILIYILKPGQPREAILDYSVVHLQVTEANRSNRNVKQSLRNSGFIHQFALTLLAYKLKIHEKYAVPTGLGSWNLHEERRLNGGPVQLTLCVSSARLPWRSHDSCAL